MDNTPTLTEMRRQLWAYERRYGSQSRQPPVGWYLGFETYRRFRIEVGITPPLTPGGRPEYLGLPVYEVNDKEHMSIGIRL